MALAARGESMAGSGCGADNLPQRLGISFVISITELAGECKLLFPFSELVLAEYASVVRSSAG